MKKYLLYGLVVGAVAAVVLLFATTVFATQNPKINICHATSSEENPYNAIRVDDDGHWNGHDDHEGDFLYEGPVRENGHPTRDGDEWCEEQGEDPSPTPTPSPSPTPEPEEYCDDESAINYGKEEECEYEEEPTPTPSPSPTPTPTPEPTVTTQSQPGPASAPVCSDATPEKAPANFQVHQGVPNDGKLTITWDTNTGANHGNEVFIAYSESKGGEKYGTGLILNDGTEEIGELTNGQHYWFKTRYQNGCAPGPWTGDVDPTP